MVVLVLRCVVGTLLVLASCFRAVQALQDVADEVVTTTACPSARTSPFVVRLDTIYLYNVEYLKGTDLDVGNIEGAIDMSVASGLDSCSEQYGEPEHGVMRSWSDRHEIVTGGEWYFVGQK